MGAARSSLAPLGIYLRVTSLALVTGLRGLDLLSTAASVASPVAAPAAVMARTSVPTDPTLRTVASSSVGHMRKRKVDAASCVALAKGSSRGPSSSLPMVVPGKHVKLVGTPLQSPSCSLPIRPPTPLRKGHFVAPRCSGPHCCVLRNSLATC